MLFKKFRKKIAILMILLVVMLPLYSASVFAALEVEARGEFNVKNFIKETDYIIFKATASIPGDDAITPNQLVLGSSVNFDSCAASINGFNCQLRFPQQGTDRFDAKGIPYTITLKNDNGNIVETKTDNFYVDNLPPVIEQFNLDRNLINSGTLKFSFDISDRACNDAGCSGKCSGLSRLELTEANGNFEETVTLNTQSCSISDVYETASSFSDGEYTIIAKAYDKFNHVSSAATASFEFDKTAPVIDANTFRIADSLDNNINYFGLSAVPVIVKVDIRDADLDKQNIFAGLNELDKLGNLGNERGICGETVNSITTCSWNINLNPANSGIKTITISATDNSGNNAEKAITKNLDLDDNGPGVLSLASTRIVDGKSYARLIDNDFIATLREGESGISVSDIKLHYENSVKSADSCEQAVDLWQCAWTGIDFSNAGTTSVFIDSDSKDRIGNTVSPVFSTDVIVDNSQSRLLQIVVRAIGGSEEALSVAKTYDKIQVEAAIEDDSISTAVGDFSNFISGLDNLEADVCVKTGDRTIVCSWTTPSIDIQGYINDVITLKFTDISGNVLEVAEPFTVYGVSGEESPDFFDNEVVCSPSLLDRETMSMISQRAFCQVILTPKSNNVEPLSVSLGECSGDTSFAESFELFNEVGSENFIRVKFNQQTANVDDIMFDCPLNIISRKGTEVFINPETENVNLKFGLYNMPLGELAANIQKEIDNAKEDATEMWDYVGYLKDFMFYATRSCQIGNIIATIIGTFNSIGDIIRAMTIANGGLTEGNRMAWDFSTEELRQSGMDIFGGKDGISSFCGFVNCKATPGPGGKVDFTFGGAKNLLDNWKIGGEKFIGSIGGDFGGDFVDDWFGDPKTKKKPISEYMNPKDSIVVATLTGCISGIIHGIDKYRQIQCMYADCLETGVGKQGLPVYACDDQKAYAECKYVTGEIFKAIPFTAIFDYYANMIKSAFSNPFALMGAGIRALCTPEIIMGAPWLYSICSTTKVISFIGATLQEVTSIFEEGVFTINEDYCDRLDDDEDEGDDND